MDNIYKSAKLEKKKIHWSMECKVVIKIVATGGETTWLVVCYLRLLLCFYVTVFLPFSFPTSHKKPPLHTQKLLLSFLTLFSREEPSYQICPWCLHEPRSRSSVKAVKKTQKDG